MIVSLCVRATVSTDQTVTRCLSLQILIRNRATDLDARMHDGTTPLILAARLAVEGMVDELINCHADVNAIDDFGKGLLFGSSDDKTRQNAMFNA